MYPYLSALRSDSGSKGQPVPSLPHGHRCWLASVMDSSLPTEVAFCTMAQAGRRFFLRAVQRLRPCHSQVGTCLALPPGTSKEPVLPSASGQGFEDRVSSPCSHRSTGHTPQPPPPHLASPAWACTYVFVPRNGGSNLPGVSRTISSLVLAEAPPRFPLLSDLSFWSVRPADANQRLGSQH